jgi:DNA-binding MarR family transcriptional regulator
MSSRNRSEVVEGLIRAWRAARLQTDLLDDAAFQKLGINRTDGRCLDVLGGGPMTATALAASCGISSNALTTVVDRLAGRGLVQRIRDPADRRRVVISLTPLAEHLSAQLYGPVIEWSLAMFAEYTTAELELVTSFLDRGRQFQAQHIEYIRKLELSWTLPDQGGAFR